MCCLKPKTKLYFFLIQKENLNNLSSDLWMRSGNSKIFAVTLQNSVLKGRVWSCSGKLSSVTREALIIDIHRVSSKVHVLCLDKLCLCGNYPFIQLCSCPSAAPEAPRASSTHQTLLPVPARGRGAAAAVGACQLLLPAAALPVPTAALARAL